MWNKKQSNSVSDRFLNLKFYILILKKWKDGNYHMRYMEEKCNEYMHVLTLVKSNKGSELKTAVYIYNISNISNCSRGPVLSNSKLY